MTSAFLPSHRVFDAGPQGLRGAGVIIFLIVSPHFTHGPEWLTIFSTLTFSPLCVLLCSRRLVSDWVLLCRSLAPRVGGGGRRRLQTKTGADEARWGDNYQMHLNTCIFQGVYAKTKAKYSRLHRLSDEVYLCYEKPLYTCIKTQTNSLVYQSTLTICFPSKLSKETIWKKQVLKLFSKNINHQHRQSHVPGGIVRC